MSTPTGIEKRLHKRADKELGKAVDGLIGQLKNGLNAFLPGSYSIHNTVQLKKGDEIVLARSVEMLLNDIRNNVISVATPEYREQIVAEFIQKVDTLGDQLDDLRDEIHN